MLTTVVLGVALTATAGWWLKAAQLDLEAKGIIKRAPSKPVQLYRTNFGT
jgi:hypothetical protein